MLKLMRHNESTISPRIVIGLWAATLVYLVFFADLGTLLRFEKVNILVFLVPVLFILPTLYMTGWYFATKVLNSRLSLMRFGTWWYGLVHLIIGYLVFYSQLKGIYLVSATVIGIVMGSTAGYFITRVLNIEMQIGFLLMHLLGWVLVVHGGIFLGVWMIAPRIGSDPMLSDLIPLTLSSAVSSIGTGILCISVVTWLVIPHIKLLSDDLQPASMRFWFFGLLLTIIEYLSYRLSSDSLPLSLVVGIAAGSILWLLIHPQSIPKEEPKTVKL